MRDDDELDLPPCVSEYVRELIRSDERRKAEELLEAKRLEGLSSAGAELTAGDWTAIRQVACHMKARQLTSIEPTTQVEADWTQTIHQ